MKTLGVDSTTLKFVASISEEAQKRASEEQDQEFAEMLRDKAPNLRCIGCNKEVEFIRYDFENKESMPGYFWGGGLLTDRMSFGSEKHDMSKVAVLVCDDCIIEKGLSSDWLDKLHRHFDIVSLERKGAITPERED